MHRETLHKTAIRRPRRETVYNHDVHIMCQSFLESNNIVFQRSKILTGVSAVLIRTVCQLEKISDR